MQNYYRLLGIPPTASPTEIGVAYQRHRSRLLRLARHDRHMQARLEEIEDGYQILGNPRRRAAYDQLRLEEPDDELTPAAQALQRRRALMARYARIARSVNLALLACCLLLGLDWGLPLRLHDQERVLALTRVSGVVASPIADPQLAYQVTTAHSEFRLRHAQGYRVRVGQRLQVWRTPLLGVVRWVATPDSEFSTERFQPYGGNIYTRYAWLPALLLLMVSLGLLPNRRPETYVTTAVAGAVLGLLAAVVLLAF